MPALKEKTQTWNTSDCNLESIRQMNSSFDVVSQLIHFISYFNNQYLIKHLAFIELPGYNELGFQFNILDYLPSTAFGSASKAE